MALFWLRARTGGVRALGITVEDLDAKSRDRLAAALSRLSKAPIAEPEEGSPDIVKGKVTPIEKARE